MVFPKSSTWIIRPLPHVTTRNKIKLVIKYELPSKRCTLSSSEKLRENFSQETECLSYNHAGNVRKEISEAKQVEFLVSRMKAWMFISVILHPTFCP